MATVSDQSHSLILNEVALQQLPEDKRPHFIFKWLRFLDKILVAADKADIKSCQQKLVSQLTALLEQSLGPPARTLLARCLSTLFSVGDTFLLFNTVNKCNDIIKVKDDSPNYLPTRLAAICCLGSMYEKLGRMMGRSYESTVMTLIRSLKSSESQARLEIIITLEKICVGLGSAAPLALREVSRAARASLLSDRSPAVRAAAAHALTALLSLSRPTQAEADSVAGACLRAAHGSCYRVRMAVAELLGSLIAATQEAEANQASKHKMSAQNVMQSKKETKNVMSLDEALNLLMGAFLRGGTSFLKGEIIKSGSGVNREVRITVTHAYVIFVQKMGGSWLERNMTTFLNHILDLVSNPKAASSHVDAVYSRKCINYIMRSTLGKMLGEKAQASACKEIVQIVVKQMNNIDFNPENAKDCNQESLFSRHLLACALLEVAQLCLQLGTAVCNLLSPSPPANIMHAIFAVLVHPCAAARLSAAWCLRCLCIALPSQITPSIDKCIEALESTHTTPEAISGYACALAAVLGAVRHSSLGAPHGRGKMAFNAAEQLLRSAGQSSRLTAARTNAGWLIVGAVCTLGVPVVRGLLPRMLLLWRNSFPRSEKELESEKARGDAFTWQVTLEGRAGALSAMHSLLVHCPSLANSEDTAQRLTQPIDGAIKVLSNISGVVRGYSGALKAPAALLRLRLCQTAGVLPAPAAPAAPLLRCLAAELAGSADPSGATVATGILRSALHPRDAILLGPEGWIYDTDHAEIEEQLVCPLSASGSGALEHDPCCLYQSLPDGLTSPAPLPLGVAVIDASVRLFGLIFCRAVNKHRLQMLEHFSECIKMSKGPRLEALQVNVYTALLLALRGLAEAKSSLGQDDVKTVAVNLVLAGLSSNSQTVRAASAACAGRLCARLADPDSAALTDKVVSLARTSSHRGARAAAAAAVGAIQRGRGAAATAVAVPVLRALAMDAASVEVQVWSLHALSVIADACGPMFRAHVAGATDTALQLLLCRPPHEDCRRAAGRLLGALVTVVGPELRDGTIGRFLCGCAALAEGGEGCAEAIGCLQQLQLFCPGHVSLHTLVPMLCRQLSSVELGVRRAALCCLRQLSQREAAAVCRYAMLAKDHVPERPYCGVTITDSGLPGALFSYLDMETDPAALSYAKDTLVCCLLAPTCKGERGEHAWTIRDWLVLCKKVLTVRQEDTHGPEQEDGEGDDDQAEFHADSDETTHPTVQPRWPTRVFAMECVQKIIWACEASGDPAHFDLVKAKEMTSHNSEYLVWHLPELVRMSFVGATGEADSLRLSALATLRLLIDKFAAAAEPDLPGHHLLLEQYMAQIGAALRPAFSSDTASHVTAAACDVCSTWIGSGVARDINDLRRVHQLLVSSLNKLSTKGNTTLVYNESMATLEKLSILKAWAEVYIVAMVSNGSAPGSYIKQLHAKPISGEELAKWRNRCGQSDLAFSSENADDDYGEFESKGESLLRLVEPELSGLGANWLAALRDHALLSLPPEFGSQLPHGGGAFYSAETAEASRLHYARAWPSLLYAAALRFNAHIKDGGRDDKTESAGDKSPTKEGGNTEFFDPVDEKFHLLFGICMEALCAQRDTTVENTVSVLLAMVTLLDAAESRVRLMRDRALAIEVCNTMHRIGLTQERVEPLLLAADVLHLVITGAREDLRRRMAAEIKVLAPEQTEENIPEALLEVVHTLGEGGPTGDLVPAQSLVFAGLEVALCLLVRRLPALSPLEREGKVGVIGTPKGLGVHGDALLVKSLACMSELPSLTSPQGALSILPTILYLGTGVLRCAGDCAAAAEAGVLLLQRAAACDAASVTAPAREQCGILVQSTLAKVLHLVKTDEPDHISPLLGARAMAALLPRAAACSALHCTCINHFRRCLDTADPHTFAATCHIIATLWSSGAAWAGWWARALAPRVAARAAAARAGDEAAAEAALAALDQLVAAVPGDTRVRLLRLLVPLAGSYLRAPAELTAVPAARALHELGLRWLARVGPRYPQELKTMMQQSPELRAKLQAALAAGAAPAPPAAPARRAPAILLRRDFSDFR